MALLAARGLARLLAALLAAALAVGGLAVALFSIQGDGATLSLPALAGRLHLGDLQVAVGMWLADLQADGPVARVAALAGAGAVALGVLLLFGVLVRRRERLLVMRSDADGTIAARPGAVGQAAVALGEQSRDVLRATDRTTARRRGVGGRLRLTIYHAPSTDAAGTTAAGRVRIQGLADAFSLRADVRGRAPRRGSGAG
jgi:hypothetical protein